MSKEQLLFVAMLLAVCVAGSATAQVGKIYMCKDAKGRTLTSDRPIPECANLPTRELGKDGSLRREIAPPLTPEQRRQKKLDEEKKKADLIALEERKAKDLALLSTYRSEKEIEAARDRTIMQLRADIVEANNGADAAERKRKVAQSEVDKFTMRNHKAPTELQQRMEEAAQIAGSERKRADKLELDLQAQKAKYEATLARFRELNREEEVKAAAMSARKAGVTAPPSAAANAVSSAKK